MPESDSISGFGQTGPLRDMPGHDVNYAALTGVADQIGNAAGPALSNLPVADLLGGTMAAGMGILAALFDAARTGRGRHVDIAVADGVLAHGVLPLAGLHQHGQVPLAGAATLTGGLACYGFYHTADSRQLAVGALEPKFFQGLCQRIERPDLMPLHRSGDPATQERLRGELAAIFAARPLAHWTQLFEDWDGCVSPVLRLDETLAHPHFRARDVWVAPDAQSPAQFGYPVKMTGFEPGPPTAAPVPGEHTDDILRQAGLADDEVAALRVFGAIV